MRMYRAMIGGLKWFSFTPVASTFAKNSCREREKKDCCSSGKRARQEKDYWEKNISVWHFCILSPSL